MSLPSRKIGNATSYKTPPTFCPHCGEVWDGAGTFDAPREPGPGDFAVCIECAGLGMYDDELRLRAPTAADIAEAEREGGPGLVEGIRTMQRRVMMVAMRLQRESRAPSTKGQA